MFSVKGKTIKLTRGDTFKATIGIYNADGTAYTPASGDVIVFTMKKSYKDETAIITKTIDHASLALEFDPSDTSSLAYGEYVFDVQLTYANGNVDTFIDKGKLVLTEEVS